MEGTSDDEECDIPAPCERDAPRAQRRARLQYLEDLLNSGTLTRDERMQILMGDEINQWGMSDGGYSIKK
ncbi:MAG: hypothetical protein M3Y28_11835 [Armatimonadota bacterium]|nr:hypothetical protein [Armatimonadota bacterium]